MEISFIFMKTFTFILVVSVFLQSSFLPFNLVLILLICKSLAKPDKYNLILAFGAGILVGILQSQNIGFWALSFLLLVRLVSLSKMLPFSKNIITIQVVLAIAIIAMGAFERVYLGQSFESSTALTEIFLSLPVYIILMFWNERFILKTDSRLKLRN